MRFRAAPSALALALAVTLGAAAPSYAEPERPELPAQASDRAEQALATATDVLAGLDDSIEPSTALRELFLLRDQLEGSDRQQADQILARPDNQSPPALETEDGNDWDHQWDPEDEAPPVCNANVCVHYITKPGNPNQATQAQARATLDAMTRSWRVEIGTLGYLAPRKDGTRGDRDTPESKGKLDVYLAELSGMGAFGYAVPEPDPAATSDGLRHTATGYMVLDQDFAEYGPRPAAYRKVTAAHELFHLVQYGYRIMAEGGRWFMESTATWVEERVYDGINDNRAYLQYGQLGRPRLRLTLANGGAEYGNWIIHEFYTQRRGNVLVRRAWENAARGQSWYAAMGTALVSARWDWPRMYAAFAANNFFPGAAYSEGAAYRDVVAKPLRRRADSRGSATLAPLSSVTFQFRPESSLLYKSGPRLTLTVNLASGPRHRAYVIRNLVNGGVRRYLIPVDRTGAGRIVLPFGADGTRSVTLTMVNASLRSGVPASYVASTR